MIRRREEFPQFLDSKSNTFHREVSKIKAFLVGFEIADQHKDLEHRSLFVIPLEIGQGVFDAFVMASPIGLCVVFR